METNETLDGLIQMAAFRGKQLREYGMPCKVLSYDEESATIECDPIDGKAEYLSCKLQTSASNGLLYVPVIGSIVMVEQTSENSAYVTMWGEVEEVIFLGGENKGMVKVTELVDKLNSLEKDINTLKNLFTTWVPVPNDGGLALQVITAAWQGQTLTPTQISDLENDKVQH